MNRSNTNFMRKGGEGMKKMKTNKEKERNAIMNLKTGDILTESMQFNE